MTADGPDEESDPAQSAETSAVGGLFAATGDPTLAYGDGTPPRVVAANRSFVDAFGAPSTGEPLSAALPGAGPADVVERAARGESGRAELSREVDGERRQFVVRVVPAHGDGDPAGFVSYTDVTDWTAGVERLEGFVRAVSHDLRGPIDVANARLTAARETGEPVHFEKAAAALDRMEELVVDVLTLARRGRVIGDVERVALAAAVDDAWTAVAGPARLDVDGPLPVVEADPTRLRELLENLFRNGVEHGTGPSDRTGGRTPADRSPEPSGDGFASRDADAGAVTVTVGSLDGGFYVADDGVGIDPADRETVFEPGYSTGGSTGLGLAIVRRIADAHGWSVRAVESDRGGARFEVLGVETTARE
jgi:signal transduction histidine kinase